MIKNYFKITLNVLKRNKLFTAISLFGISFTMVILLVGASFLDNFTQSNYPAKHQNRIAYIVYVTEWNEKLDNGEYGKSSPTSLSYYVFKNYIATLKTPSMVSLYSRSAVTLDGFVDSRSFDVDIKYTDNVFWNILDFKFLEGRPYTLDEVNNAQNVCVISESLANEQFENPGTAIGKFIDINKTNYQIIGVVKNVPQISISAYGNIWVPFTVSGFDRNERSLSGDLAAMMLVQKKSDFETLENELNQSLIRIEYPVGDIQLIEVSMTQQKDLIFNHPYAPIKGPLMYAIFSLIIFSVILIPSLNLTTINTTRIRERLSEIGIRKTFGASKKTLILQFLVENIILTLIGGLIAFILAFAILKIFQATGTITSTIFPINIRIFFAGLGLCLVFGFVSGVTPAMKMAKFHIVESLNDNRL